MIGKLCYWEDILLRGDCAYIHLNSVEDELEANHRGIKKQTNKTPKRPSNKKPPT